LFAGLNQFSLVCLDFSQKAAYRASFQFVMRENHSNYEIHLSHFDDGYVISGHHYRMPEASP
jgi:hypothetical protein